MAKSRFQTAELIRTRDWSQTPLCPLDSWPATLRTLTDVILRSPAGMALIWGDDRLLLDNGGFARVCGSRHPHVLGTSVLDAYPESLDFNTEVFNACFAGEERVFRDMYFAVDRNGTPQEARFDLITVRQSANTAWCAACWRPCRNDRARTEHAATGPP